MIDAPHFKALTLFVAAFGALNIAMALGLTNPYWAAMPVFVVSQTWREDILIRGALRIAGTLLGAAIGIGVLLATDSAVVHIFAMGVTVAVFAGLSYWIGTVYSYGAMLAAITPMVILLPAIATQHDPVGLGIDRAWCTLIGVVAVTATTAIFTPKRTEKMPLHTDHGRDKTWRRGAFAGVMSILAVTLSETAGGIFALSAGLAIAMFAILMASMPDPRPMLKYLIPGALIGVTTGLIYRALLDTLDLQGAGLILITGVFMAALSWLRSHPKTAPLGLDANMIFLLTAEVGGPGHSLSEQGLGALALLTGAVILISIYGRLLTRNAV